MIWDKKYEIAISETINTKGIGILLGKPHKKARETRIEFLVWVEDQDIKLADYKNIPTELFLEFLEKDIKYYERKMNQELKLIKVRKELGYETK